MYLPFQEPINVILPHIMSGLRSRHEENENQKELTSSYLEIFFGTLCRDLDMPKLRTDIYDCLETDDQYNPQNPVHVTIMNI